MLAVCPCLSFHLGLIDLLAFPVKSPLLAQCQHPAPDADSSSQACFAQPVCECVSCVFLSNMGARIFEIEKGEGSTSHSVRPVLVQLCMGKLHVRTVKGRGLFLIEVEGPAHPHAVTNPLQSHSRTTCTVENDLDLKVISFPFPSRRAPALASKRGWFAGFPLTLCTHVHFK